MRLATVEDLDTIEHIIHGAIERLAHAGIDQWQRGYPNGDSIARDVALGYGRVVEQGGEIVAYGALVYDGEAAYDALVGGSWLTEGRYATIHRLCTSQRATGRGYGRAFMTLAEEEARLRVGSIRVDTHPHNQIMQGLICSLGYTYCGTVTYESLRLAYEKVL
jgi:GNAT superfamily N-acetyltransferase